MAVLTASVFDFDKWPNDHFITIWNSRAHEKNLGAHGGGIFFNRMRRNRYISPKPFSPASEFFVLFSWKFQLLFLSLQAMRTTKEYVDLISAHAGELRSQFGIRSLRLFGSVSRGEQTENRTRWNCCLLKVAPLKRAINQFIKELSKEESIN